MYVLMIEMQVYGSLSSSPVNLIDRLFYWS